MNGGLIERPGGGGSTITGPSDVPGLEPMINRGAANFLRLFNKIGTWDSYGDNKALPTYSPTQVRYAGIGDSTGLHAWYNGSSGALTTRGIMKEMMDGSAKLNVTPSTTTTGTVWQADNSTHNYDHTIHPLGAYWHGESGGTLKFVSTTQASMQFLHYIEEDEAVGAGGGTATLELRNSGDSANISVGSATGTIAIDADAGVGGATRLRKAGFLYIKLNASKPNAGQFAINIPNVGQTADQAYNVSAANLETAIQTVLTNAGTGGTAGVTLASSVYTILIVLPDMAGVTGIEWVHGATPLTNAGLPSYLYFQVQTGSSWTNLKTTYTGGTLRHWSPQAWDVSKNGVIFYSMAQGGARLGNFVKLLPQLAIDFWSDFQPDFISFAWTHYQIGSETTTYPSTQTAYTLAQLQTNAQALFDQINSGWTAYDLVWQSPNPHYQDTGDADLLAANAALRTIVEAEGQHFVNLYDVVGGYADVAARGDLWVGDGVHMGTIYNAYAASTILHQMGLLYWFTLRNARRIHTDWARIDYHFMGKAGNDLDSDDLGCMIYTPDGYDIYLKSFNANRDVYIVNSGDVQKWRLSTYAGNSWIPEGCKVGSTSGAILQAAGYLSKSVAGGAGTTTLSAAESENSYYEFTGALTGNREVAIVSHPGKQIVVFNNTTGGFTLTIKPVSGTGVVVTQTKKRLLSEYTGLVMEGVAPEY